MFIITTIHTQRPTLLYVYQFYPGKTQTSVPLLSRHSQRAQRQANQPVPSLRTFQMAIARDLLPIERAG